MAFFKYFLFQEQPLDWLVRKQTRKRRSTHFPRVPRFHKNKAALERCIRFRLHILLVRFELAEGSLLGANNYLIRYTILQICRARWKRNVAVRNQKPFVLTLLFKHRKLNTSAPRSWPALSSAFWVNNIGLTVRCQSERFFHWCHNAWIWKRKIATFVFELNQSYFNV